MIWNDTVSLGDICEVIAGQSPPSNTYNKYGEGLPFFQGKSDFGVRSPKVRTWCNKPVKIAKKGDILISVRAPVGPTNICDEECCIGRGLSAIRAGKKIGSAYLQYFLKKNEHVLTKMSRGSTFKAITQKDIKQLQVPLPTLEEQNRMVHILDEADNLRQKRKESIRLLDDYIASKFEEMFGSLRLNPKNWNKYSLKDITSKITDGTHQSPEFVDSGIPFIFISNIVQNEIVLNTKKYISEQTYQELTKSTPIEKYDILYTTVGSYGHPTIVKTDKKFCFQRHIAHIKPDATKTNVYFLYGMLKTPYVKQQADERANGVAQKTLNLGELGKLQVILPPMDMQNKYATIVAKVEMTKLSMLKQSTELDNQFKVLMQNVFKGEA